MSVEFDQQGLARIQFGGQELLTSGRIELRDRVAVSGQIDSKKERGALPKIIFDDSRKRLLQTYDWGEIACVYGVTDDRINLDVEVKNTTNQDIRIIELSLMKLKLPGWADKGKYEGRWPQPINPADEPQIISMKCDLGTVLFCGEDLDRPLGLHVLPDGQADEYALILRHEGPPFMGSLIGGGDSRHFRLSVRFGPKGCDALALAGDLYKRFGDRFPRQMKWEDHRPIGTINLATSAMALKKNPRGWFQDRTGVDVTTPQGITAFHQRLLKYADDCIGFTKEMNAQGVIVWDIEGQEMPHMISYIGDPRLMEQMAPEMSGVADAFMKKFRDAGLRVGVTIRPSHVIRSAESKNLWEHVQPDDPVQEISEKIEYAKKRWGCTLFYIDSTVLWANESDGRLSLKTMPAEFFRILNQRFPDSLLIPEESDTRHWAYSAPYHEVQQGYTSTPPEVRACYPDSFTVIRVVDAGLDRVKQKHDELVAGVRSGDVLLYRTWFNDEYDAEVKRIYHDAADTNTPKRN